MTAHRYPNANPCQALCLLIMSATLMVSMEVSLRVVLTFRKNWKPYAKRSRNAQSPTAPIISTGYLTSASLRPLRNSPGLCRRTKKRGQPIGTSPKTSGTRAYILNKGNRYALSPPTYSNQHSDRAHRDSNIAQVYN